MDCAVPNVALLKIWQAILHVLDIEEIKTISHVPLSHPFIERLIGTIRREFLDHALFWNSLDLERKLTEFQHYYNQHRTHTSLNGHSLTEINQRAIKTNANLSYSRWQSSCRGLFQLPVAA